MRYLRFFLFPLAVVYMILTSLRNLFFSIGLFKQVTYTVPTLGIGNLSTGGTGKSVAVQFFIRHFKAHYPITVLSRGYGRVSKGFQVATASSTVTALGDEPMMFYRQHPDIRVAVSRSRREGMKKLLDESSFAQKGLFIWDDCFQHRWVKPKTMVLLTNYFSPYTSDFLLPVGQLRELSEGAQRAQTIIVTKCPPQMGNDEKQAMEEKMQLKSYQKVFFSSIKYSERILNKDRFLSLDTLKRLSFVLVTGIAYPEPLVDYLKKKYLNFEHMAYNDHHAFSDQDVENIKTQSNGRMVLTTEKDYVRLSPKFSSELLFYLPIEMVIHDERESELMEDIKKGLDLT